MTCLVISSGTGGDDVRDLLIRPVLDYLGYDLQVAPGRIDDRDVAVLREAALCLVDFTELTPVVAYQCGRRLETGRPTLVLLPAGHGPQTVSVDPLLLVEYDLSSARAAHESVVELQRRVETVGAKEEARSALERIEAKLDELLGRGATEEEPLAVPLRSPQERFMIAITRGDLGAAAGELDELRRQHVGDHDLVAAAGYVAAAGWKQGAELLNDIVRDRGARLAGPTLRPAISALVGYQLRTPDDRAGASALIELATRALADEERPVPDRAFLHNQLHRLHWGLGDTHEALQHARRAVAMNPEEPQYAFNLALVHLRRGEFEEAERLVDAYMNIESAPPDPDRLSQAIEVYWKRGRVDDARDTYRALVEFDAAQAMLVVGADAALRRAITSAAD